MKKKENCNDSKVENTLYEYLWKILSVEWKASQSLSLMNERMKKKQQILFMVLDFQLFAFTCYAFIALRM